MFLEFNIDVRFVACYVMRYRLSTIIVVAAFNSVWSRSSSPWPLLSSDHDITPSTPKPPISYTGNTKKRNSLAHPRPGHYHPPDLVLLRAHSESDEVDEGAGLAGRGGFL
jgi:hypothetical protein